MKHHIIGGLFALISKAGTDLQIYMCFVFSYFIFRILLLFSLQKQPITFNFIKDGGCLGALGAMLTKKKAKEDKPAK